MMFPCASNSIQNDQDSFGSLFIMTTLINANSLEERDSDLLGVSHIEL